MRWGDMFSFSRTFDALEKLQNTRAQESWKMALMYMMGLEYCANSIHSPIASRLVEIAISRLSIAVLEDLKYKPKIQEN